MTYGLVRGLPSGLGDTGRAHATRAILIAAFIAFALAQGFTVVHDLRHGFGDDHHEAPCVTCIVKTAVDNATLGAALSIVSVFAAGFATALFLCIVRDCALVQAARPRGPPHR